MTDNHTSQARHINMSHIRSTNTLPEEIVRKYLFSRGLRYRKNVRGLPGKPDIVLKKYKTIVFVNGCFWHHHNCNRFKWPSSNTLYWKKKIESNVERDNKTYTALQKNGWNILIIWECELKNSSREKVLKNLYKEIVETR